MTKMLPEAKAIVNEFTPDRRDRAIKLKTSLAEQLKAIEPIDQQILGLLEDEESTTEEETIEEIERSCHLRSEIKTVIKQMEEILGRPVIDVSKPNQQPPPNKQPPMNEQPPTKKPQKIVRVKLPKLEVRKFNGKSEEWQEFWDSFQSAIHQNDSLSDVDKFSYLKGLITGSAKATISGFALTSLNYASALIRRAHISELLNVQAVLSAHDSSRLRAFFDTIETHYRGYRGTVAVGKDP